MIALMLSLNPKRFAKSVEISCGVIQNKEQATDKIPKYQIFIT